MGCCAVRVVMDVWEHGVPACSTSCFAFDNVTVFVPLIAISHGEGIKRVWAGGAWWGSI